MARVGPEHLVGERVEEAAQVRHARPLVDHQPLDLEELEAVARVDGLVAVAAPGREDADGWARVAHRADLAR